MTAPSSRRRGTGRDGFLLVEALAALTLGALILVALLSLTGLFRRSLDRAAWGVEVTEVSRRTIDTVARELRQTSRRRWAVPPPRPGARVASRPTGADSQRNPPTPAQQQANAQQSQPPDQGDGGDGPDGAGAADGPPRPFVFSGTPDRVVFALTPRGQSGLRVPILVAYQVEEGGAVLRAEAPLPVAALGPASIQFGPVERIDPGPETLRFAYVEPRPDGGETVLDSWIDPSTMPVAIRIDRLDRATGQPLGSLRVPLLVDAEPGCASQRGLCSRSESGGGPAANGPRQPGAATDASGEPQ